MINLSNALSAPPSAPALRVDDLPSLGSVAHRLGGCRPCAFYHKRGCENAESCPFCHLCPPWEKKIRLREKRVAKREAKEAKYAALLAAEGAHVQEEQDDVEFGSDGM